MDKRIFLLAFCIFLGPFCANAVLSMLQQLGDQFGGGMVMISLTITAFILPYALLQLVSGTLSDRWNRRHTLKLGLATFIFGVFLSALTSSIPVFLAGRVLQGLGFAFVSPVGLAMIGDLVPSAQRGRVMGWMGSMTTLGIATGPLAGGILAEIDWRLVFHVIGVMGLTALLLFSCSRVGASTKKQSGPPMRALWKAAFSSKAVRIVSLTGFLAHWAYIDVLSSLSPYLSALPFGFSAARVGTIISAAGVAGIIFSPLAGWTADRIGRSVTGALGLAGVGLVFTALQLAHSWSMLSLLFFLLGGVMAFSWTGLVTLSVELLPGARGTSSSLFGSARFLGYSLAPQVSSVLFLHSGMKWVFLSAAGAALAAALLTLTLRDPEKALRAE